MLENSHFIRFYMSPYSARYACTQACQSDVNSCVLMHNNNNAFIISISVCIVAARQW